MAKIKGTYVTNLSGRVGNVVYRNSDGSNIASTRPASVYNPKSLSQMVQRVIFNSCIKAESALSVLVDHSNEGLSRKKKNFSQFMKENLALMKSDLSISEPYYFPKGAKGLPYYPFQVSKGNLERMESTLIVGADTLKTYIGLLFDMGNITPEGGLTYGEFFNTEDTYTIMCAQNVTYDDEELNENVPYDCQVRFIQFKVTQDFCDLPLSASAVLILTNDMFFNVTRYFGSTDDFEIGITSHDNRYHIVVNFNKQDSSAPMAFACWRSIETSTGWDYSTQYIDWNEGQGHFPSFTLERALSTFGVNDTNVLQTPSITIGGKTYFWNDGTFTTKARQTSLII